MEKYKFTSVVAQDLLDSFLSFFPELKEQSVDCRAGEASPLGECWCEGGWGPHLHRMPLLPGESPTGSSILPSDTLPGQCEPQAGRPWKQRGGCASQPGGAQGASRKRWHLGQPDLFRQSQKGAMKTVCAKGLGQGWQGGGRFASELTEAHWPA